MGNMYAAISADIVSSTSLSKEAMIQLHENLRKCLHALESRYRGFWGRVIKGDSIECILDSPENAFEVALILKTLVKSFDPGNSVELKAFNRYGLRIAIGIGEMKTVDRDLDMMDGDAIYRSGRALSRMKGRDKYSFAISMADKDAEAALQVIFALVNQLLNGATARKCETVHERILVSNTNKTAERMGISVSGVNQTLKDVGWSAIEQAIAYYRKITKQL